MAKKKPRLEDQLSRVAALMDEEDLEIVHRELKQALKSRSPHLVARAARVAEERRVGDLAAELKAAFERGLKEPLKSDKGCVAKTAIAAALVEIQGLEAAGVVLEETFLLGVRHIQKEPSFGRPVDTAVDLRVTSAFGLVNASYPAVMDILVDLLVDEEALVRRGAARALGDSGRVEAETVLRLKALVGDEDPDVLGECLGALLHLAPRAGLEVGQRLLNSAAATTAEAAALALGESRLEAAIKPLWQAYRSGAAESTSVFLTALSLTRREAAFDLLLERLQEAPRWEAKEILNALGIHRGDDSLSEKIAAILQRREEIDNEDAWS